MLCGERFRRSSQTSSSSSLPFDSTASPSRTTEMRDFVHANHEEDDDEVRDYVLRMCVAVRFCVRKKNHTHARKTRAQATTTRRAPLGFIIRRELLESPVRAMIIVYAVWCELCGAPRAALSSV